MKVSEDNIGEEDLEGHLVLGEQQRGAVGVGSEDHHQESNHLVVQGVLF